MTMLTDVAVANPPPRAPGRTASRSRTRHTLTSREQEVLRLLAEGMKDREIAAALGISVRTAEKHVENILRKLRARTRFDAVQLGTGISTNGVAHLTP